MHDDWLQLTFVELRRVPAVLVLLRHILEQAAHATLELLRRSTRGGRCCLDRCLERCLDRHRYDRKNENRDKEHVLSIPTC